MDDVQLSLAKSMAWQQAKGHLNAMVAAEGHRRLVVPPHQSDLDRAEEKSAKVAQAVREFIDMMEMEGWSE